MLTKQTKVDKLPKLSWKWGDIEYNMKYTVANYCFPQHWPGSTKRSAIREDERILFTFGIHPRLINLERKERLDRWIREMEELLDATKVVAVGECGLDSSDYPSELELKKQIEYFRKQIHLALKKQLPIVIHCHGNSYIDSLCLNTLSKLVPTSYPIHRHCFNGEIDDYRKWKNTLSHVKFGISPFLLQEKKYPHYRSLVCGMELEDMIVETDAPYQHPKGQTGPPLLIREIIDKLGNLFSISPDEVAKVTTKNCIDLYRIY